MPKRLLAGLFALLLLCATAACAAQDDPIPESDYLPSYTPALDQDIAGCLPAEQVSTILGVPMTAGEPYEDGTWLIYTSADSRRQVSLNMIGSTAALFGDQIAGLTDLEPLPALGEHAYWFATSGEVILFHGGYSIAVSVTDPTVASTRGLCEALASRVIANLTTNTEGN